MTVLKAEMGNSEEEGTIAGPSYPYPNMDALPMGFQPCFSTEVSTSQFSQACIDGILDNGNQIKN
jgi:hypothetical protein